MNLLDPFGIEEKTGINPIDPLGLFGGGSSSSKEEEKPKDSGFNSDYVFTLMQMMMQQMQQSFALMSQQVMQNIQVPSFESPPLQRQRKTLNVEEERQKIRERLAEEREKTKKDRRTLASTLHTSMSLLEKDPDVISGESLIKAEEG